MKKVMSIVCVLSLVLGVLFVGHQQRVEAKATEETTINVTTTMMNDCWDESFKGNVRIEEMFVTNVEYSDGEAHNVVTLEDTQGNEWVYENIDLFLDDEVLVLMCDNETTEDITDDVIIHCWVGME